MRRVLERAQSTHGPHQQLLLGPSLTLQCGATSTLVMTTLHKVSDFVYFLPFLFALYHHPEPSGTFYPDPHATAMTHTLDHPSMT